MKKFTILNLKFLDNEKGAILTLVLVFGTIFVLLFGVLSSFIYTQYRQSKEKVAYNEALAIAEAGANYARWHLAHAPDNRDFSGTYDYTDPESGTIGQYSLQITGGGACSTMVSIKSTGWSNDYPNVKRTALVRYGKPSLAKYAFLTNTDVWFGQDEEVRGPLHSNGGIRMDGIQNALFTSATTTYRCLPIHGCSSPYQMKPGIWGSGAGGTLGLWSFPEPLVNFNTITVDLNNLRTEAKDHGGYYFGPSGAYGYHIKFKNDGSFDVYKVTKLTDPVDGKDTQGVLHTESNDIGVSNGSMQLMVENGTGLNQQAYNPTVNDLVSSYANYSWQMATNPLTGSAWTAAEVNNWTTRFGVVDSSGKPQVTQIYAIANYSLSGNPTLYPSGIGNYDQWTANSGTKTNAVGPADSDDTTYISVASNQSQTFIMPNAGVPAGATINSVNLYAVARGSSSGASIKLRVENGTGGSHQSDGSTQSLTTSYAIYSRTMTTNPLTGSVWTVAEVNNWTTRFGVTRTNGTPRVTQIYIVVGYSLNGNSVSLVPSAIGDFNDWIAVGTANKVTAVANNDGDTTYINGISGSQTFVLPGAGVPAGATVNSVTLTAVARGVAGAAEALVGNYILTSGTCDARNLIFVEDLKVWVDGTVGQNVTVAAAQFPDFSDTNSTIIINGNITRSDPSLTVPALIAQKNILVPRYSPDILEIQAVMLAQKGAVQRYYYSGNVLDTITVRGSIITNNVWTWTWVSGGGTVTSGYRNTESYYEPMLIYNPPPYFPTSGDLEFISWEEVQ